MDKPKVANCSDCVFFEEGEFWEGATPNDGVYDGMCRRYPRVKGKNKGAWCGEFIDKTGPYGVYSRGYFKFPTQP